MQQLQLSVERGIGPQNIPKHCTSLEECLNAKQCQWAEPANTRYLIAFLPLPRSQPQMYIFGELVLVAFVYYAELCLPSSNAVLHIPHRVFHTEQQSILRGQPLDSSAWISNGPSPELHSLKPPRMLEKGKDNYPWKSLSPETDSQRNIAGNA